VHHALTVAQAKRQIAGSVAIHAQSDLGYRREGDHQFSRCVMPNRSATSRVVISQVVVRHVSQASATSIESGRTPMPSKLASPLRP
jgi:hypothetical protein